MSRASKIFQSLIVTFFVLASTSGCQTQNRAHTPVETPQTIGDFPLEEYWKKDFDGEISAMAFSSDILIAGIVDDNGAVIQAFDVSTGFSRWRSEFPGNGIDINIMAYEKAAYVIYDSQFSAIDLDTGNLLFQTDIGASIGDEIVAVSEEHVFVVQISEGVYVYDKFTGKPSWQISFGRGHVDMFLNTTHEFVNIVHGEYLRVFNEQDGSLAWENKIGFHGAVGFRDDVLYYAASEVKGEAETDIHAFDVGTKSQLWVSRMGSDVDCITIDDDELVAETRETIAMIDSKSGNKIWEYYISISVYCPPVRLDDVIYLKDGSNNQIIAMRQVDDRLNPLGTLDFEDSSGIGYKIPEDNLLASTHPFPFIAFYLRNSIYVYK